MKLKFCKKCDVELIRFYNKVKDRLICHDYYKEVHKELWKNRKDKISQLRKERRKPNGKKMSVYKDLIKKELKALKILQKISKHEPDIRKQRNNIDINFTIHDFTDINKAIKELKDM